MNEIILTPTVIRPTITNNEIELVVENNPIKLELNTGIVNVFGSSAIHSVAFNHTHYAANLTITSIPSGATILNTVVEVTTAFDSGSLTIGTDSAQGILMTSSERSNGVDLYERVNYLENSTTQNYKAYFSGTPTQGAGRIIIYYI